MTTKPKQSLRSARAATTRQRQTHGATTNKSRTNPLSAKGTSLQLTSERDRIILAISGGPDSVFLLHQLLTPTLLNIQPLRREQIILAHVNYHLRGRDSDADQKFVEKLAKKFGLKLETLSAHPGTDTNLEARCRDIRYDFFETLRRRHHASHILTAHHLNDQIETFLLCITRGAALSGFSGMSHTDPARHLIRPLLHISKKQISHFLDSAKTAYREDKSNTDPRFSRNRIRSHIIPELEKINSNFIFTLEQTMQHFADNQAIIEDLCVRWCDTNLDAKFTFGLDNFLAEIPALQRKLLSHIYRKIHGTGITSAQIREILATLQKNRAGLQKEFGPRTTIAVSKSLKTHKRQVVIKRELH